MVGLPGFRMKMTNLWKNQGKNVGSSSKNSLFPKSTMMEVMKGTNSFTRAFVILRGPEAELCFSSLTMFLISMGSIGEVR